MLQGCRGMPQAGTGEMSLPLVSSDWPDLGVKVAT